MLCYWTWCWPVDLSACATVRCCCCDSEKPSGIMGIPNCEWPMSPALTCSMTEQYISCMPILDSGLLYPLIYILYKGMIIPLEVALYQYWLSLHVLMYMYLYGSNSSSSGLCQLICTCDHHHHHTLHLPRSIHVISIGCMLS